MMPATHNLEYYRGDTLRLYLIAKNRDGSPMDLTGHTASFVIATERGDSPTPPDGYPAQVACSTNVIVEESRIECTITNANGLQLKAGTPYVYNISVSGGGEVHTYLTGNVNVTERVVAP